MIDSLKLMLLCPHQYYTFTVAIHKDILKERTEKVMLAASHVKKNVTNRSISER